MLNAVDDVLPGRALLMLVNGTGLAKHVIKAKPQVAWEVFTCEHFFLENVVSSLSAEDSGIPGDTEIEVSCLPDPPEGTYNTILLATDSKGSSELTRDFLQSASRRLTKDGRLIATTDNARDHWLGEHLKATYGKVTVRREKEGITYIARKRPEPAKEKNFHCEFAFRDGERLIPLASRPGVFSHRRVDAGARALVKSLNLLEEGKKPKRKPQRIVELGSGCGAVSVAAALRYPSAAVLAVDSHARAVEATQRSAELNNVQNLATMLTSNGVLPDEGRYDLFLCNPPYYSDFRISEVFLQSAHAALKPGGRMHLVTKLNEWHHNRTIELFANGEAHEIGSYFVITAVRR